MTHRIAVLCGAATLAVTLAGCAGNREEFGSSVRHMVEGQTYDPAAPRPELGAVDGRKAAQAVDAYLDPKPAAKAAKTSGGPAIFAPTQ
jgi:hypothetical protein